MTTYPRFSHSQHYVVEHLVESCSHHHLPLFHLHTSSLYTPHARGWCGEAHGVVDHIEQNEEDVRAEKNGEGVRHAADGIDLQLRVAAVRAMCSEKMVHSHPVFARARR